MNLFLIAQVVVISTSMGDIKVQLDSKKAPVSTKNFLEYVKQKHYDGMVFHRVIRNFMIQGGGFDEKLHQVGAKQPAIKNEAGNGLKNAAGFVQSKLARRLQTRFTPVVHFVLDQGVKKSIEMTRLINEALGQTAPARDARDEDVPGAVHEAGSADGTAEEEPRKDTAE